MGFRLVKTALLPALSLIALMSVALMPTAPARAETLPLVAENTLTIGMSPTFPPFEYIQDGKTVGFDVDLADLLTKKLGITFTTLPIDFKGIIPALTGKRIDVIISGMYVSAERLQVADFVPYLLVGNQVVVKDGNPLHLNGEESLCGHRVAAPVGTVFEASANKASAACEAAGKQKIDLLSLAGTAACALALTQDRTDAIIVSTPTAVALMQATPGTYATAGAPFDNSTKVGIAVSKENPKVFEALTKAMKDVVADGDYAKLLAKWKMPASSSAF
jgi:polar amino acid transport system substrate-binding protein